MKVYKLTNLEMTCGSCPSQWDATTSTGEDVYIRYRWGGLSVKISGERVFYKQVGGSYDGTMTTEEMKMHTKDVLNFEDCVEVNDE